jgi:hypothetical protein
VRPAARPPERDEAVEPERVEDGCDVAGRVGDAAPLLPRRPGVSRARGRDELPAARVDGLEQQRELVRRVRRAALEHEREGVRRAVAQHLEVAPVGHAHGRAVSGH